MDTAEALKLARTSMQVRYQQLASCRVCGVEAQRYEKAIEIISGLEETYKEKPHDVPIQQE